VYTGSMPSDSPHNPEQTRVLSYASGLHLPAQGEGEALDCYRAGELLLAFNGCTLPERCLLCGNAGAGLPVKLSFTWDSSFTVTRISTLQLRQQAYVHAYLCAAHRGRWSRARRNGGIGIAAGVAAMGAGMALGMLSENADVPRWTPLAIGLVIGGF